MSQVVVVATLEARPDREAEVERELRMLVPATHAEAGCILYALHRSLDDPRMFVFVERWTSAEALDEHRRAAHLQRFGELAGDLLAGPPQVFVLEALPDGDLSRGAL